VIVAAALSLTTPAVAEVVGVTVRSQLPLDLVLDCDDNVAFDVTLQLEAPCWLLDGHRLEEGPSGPRLVLDVMRNPEQPPDCMPNGYDFPRVIEIGAPRSAGEHELEIVEEVEGVPSVSFHPFEVQGPPAEQVDHLRVRKNGDDSSELVVTWSPSSFHPTVLRMDTRAGGDFPSLLGSSDGGVWAGAAPLQQLAFFQARHDNGCGEGP
jgi:hypothetical protein